jgi:hypothetical protein
MSRLPELERELFDAAERLEAPRHARRWRRRGAPLLVALGSLVVVGGAVAAATGLLATGDPVPPERGPSVVAPVRPSAGFRLAGVRVADPEGGPAWGIGTYDSGAGGTCVVVGRVQNRRLGVVGRDGVFGNDGRFHVLSPGSQGSAGCGGRAPDGSFILITSQPPIPASGYTGAPGTAIGGCRERVNLNGPTVSPQTRRRLRDVPQCAHASLRRVIAGFAGPRAVKATLTEGGRRTTLRLDPKESGPYLFVTRPSGALRLTVTLRDGTVCRLLGRGVCAGLMGP